MEKIKEIEVTQYIETKKERENQEILDSIITKMW